MAMRWAASWLGFALLISFSVAAYADLDTAINKAILEATTDDTTRTNKQKLFKNRCATIAETVGFEKNVTGQARKYSCDVPGIGIALYAGSDLGKHSPEKVGEYFIDALAKEGLQAQVFIKPDHEYGSSMAFYINAESWRREPARVSEVANKIDLLAAHTKLVLLTDGRIDSWPEAPPLRLMGF